MGFVVHLFYYAEDYQDHGEYYQSVVAEDADPFWIFGEGGVAGCSSVEGWVSSSFRVVKSLKWEIVLAFRDIESKVKKA